MGQNLGDTKHLCTPKKAQVLHYVKHTGLDLKDYIVNDYSLTRLHTKPRPLTMRLFSTATLKSLLVTNWAPTTMGCCCGGGGSGGCAADPAAARLVAAAAVPATLHELGLVSVGGGGRVDNAAGGGGGNMPIDDGSGNTGGFTLGTGALPAADATTKDENGTFPSCCCW